MCIAFPARVLAIESADAIIDLDGRRRRASLRMQPGVEVGDWVLVGAGSVLRRLDAREADEIAQALKAAIASTDARLAATSPGGPR